MDIQMEYEINKELAECYLFMSDFDHADDYYRKAAQINTKAAAPYIGLATVAVQRGKFDEAILLYKKAASVEESDKALCGVGLVHMETGDHDHAYDWFKKSLDMRADNMIALNCLVREAYALERVDEVLPYLARAAEISPEKETITVTLAGCLIYLKRFDEAKIHLESILSVNPENDGAKELISFMAA